MFRGFVSFGALGVQIPSQDAIQAQWRQAQDIAVAFAKDLSEMVGRVKKNVAEQWQDWAQSSWYIITLLAKSLVPSILVHYSDVFKGTVVYGCRDISRMVDVIIIVLVFLAFRL